MDSKRSFLGNNVSFASWKDTIQHFLRNGFGSMWESFHPLVGWKEMLTHYWLDEQDSFFSFLRFSLCAPNKKCPSTQTSLSGIFVQIAALSPADINYEETLSTLRFGMLAFAILWVNACIL